jgi:hypothetical protein
MADTFPEAVRSSLLDVDYFLNQSQVSILGVHFIAYSGPNSAARWKLSRNGLGDRGESMTGRNFQPLLLMPGAKSSW